ncbi:MAG: rhodanese-like domain-containing protein [Acidobacteria bacterium]|nr:MAG: rhodanese-like domain-containing protein [Acidobacteriota bacterium]
MFKSRIHREVDAQMAARIAAQSGTVVLDIRTPKEYQSGTIEGSINIDFHGPTFNGDLGELDKDAHYVVF